MIVLSRDFSKREKVLLAVLAALLLVVFYYTQVWVPYTEGIAQARADQTAAEDEILVQEALAQRRDSMETELQELLAQGADATPIPEFDNAKNVMKVLNTVLAQATSYTLSFKDLAISEDSSLVRRSVSMTFSSESYAEAKAILTSLQECGYRCQLGNLAIEPEGDLRTSPVHVTLSVVFFESNGDSVSEVSAA
ncbi:MAG: type II secretion system protein GspM [Oscillospiraceae bacterium]|nr:type II secretion system protein GspM [Oscillospiraceae bacterium]